jgi:predicted ATPase
MKLLSVEIENFRAIESLNLSFLDPLRAVRPVTVFSGPNGTGKTSILFAITNALRGVMGYRTADVPEPTQDDIRLPRNYGIGWNNRTPEARVTVALQFDDEEQDAIREILAISDWESPPSLPEGQIKVIWSFPPEFDSQGKRRHWWNADVEPHLPNVRSWLSGRRLAIQAWNGRKLRGRFDLLTKIGGIRFFPQNRDLRDRVVGRDEPENANSMDGIGSQHDSADSELSAPIAIDRSVTSILQFLSSYAKNRATPLPDDRNWEKRIQEMFHRICHPKSYVGYLYREETPLGAPIIQDDVYRYPLSHAASGEMVILDYITRLTYPTPLDNSVILIDEPEIHLHPAWVRKLYFALPTLGANNQFVLTSHSPELRQRALADNCAVDLGSLEVSHA